MTLLADPWLTVEEARDRLPELANRATHEKGRTVITDGGKPVAVLVPIEDLDLLEDLETPF